MARPDRSAREDVAACRRILALGSKSFAAAGRLLPGRVRDDSAAFYAFCRVADDAVDESREPAAAVTALRARLDEVYAGRPADDPVDRALARVVREHAIPRELFDALLEGFSWDAQRRTYDDVPQLLGYCARVASAVGVVMTLIMGVRRPDVLARACDLGAAMQLTNIARDVGEDARRGRLYLPRDWLAEEGVDAAGFLQRPVFTPSLRRVIERALALAAELYARADSGVPYLPPDCRPAIRAARLIYSEIAREIARAGGDSVSRRAFVSTPRKLWLLWRARTGPDERPALPPAQPEFLFLLPGAGPG